MTEDALTPLDENPPATASKVSELAKSIDLNNQSLSITYGADTMQEIARFADSMRSRVRAKDAGPLGETLTGRPLQAMDVDLSALAKDDRGFL